MWIYCLFYLYCYVQSVKIFLFFSAMYISCVYCIHYIVILVQTTMLNCFFVAGPGLYIHTHKKKLLSWAGVVADSHTKSRWVCSFVTGAALKQRIIFLQCGSQQTDYTKHCHKNFFMQLEEVMNWFLGSRTHGYFYTPLSWPRNQSCMKPWVWLYVVCSTCKKKKKKKKKTVSFFVWDCGFDVTMWLQDSGYVTKVKVKGWIVQCFRHLTYCDPCWPRDAETAARLHDGPPTPVWARRRGLRDRGHSQWAAVHIKRSIQEDYMLRIGATAGTAVCKR